MIVIFPLSRPSRVILVVFAHLLSDLRLARETETNVYFFNFTQLQYLNDRIYVYTKELLFGTWQFDKIGVGQFHHSKICNLFFLSFSGVR